MGNGHTHTYTNERTHTHARTHARTRTHTRTHTHMHARTHAHIHTRAHTHTHARTHTHTHTHTHTSSSRLVLSRSRVDICIRLRTASSTSQLRLSSRTPTTSRRTDRQISATKGNKQVGYYPTPLPPLPPPSLETEYKQTGQNSNMC